MKILGTAYCIQQRYDRDGVTLNGNKTMQHSAKARNAMRAIKRKRKVNCFPKTSCAYFV